VDPRISAVLSTLEKQSFAEKTGQIDLPRGEMMQAITHDTGLFFNVLIIAGKAKRILEIGTSAGYSALWFADALKINYGTQKPVKAIITIESNPSKAVAARKNFKNAGVGSMIEILEGNALDSLKAMSKAYLKNSPARDKKFDLVFLDADKENLIEYFDLALPMTRVGGIIAADNVLYPDEYRDVMQRYLDYISKVKNVQSVTVPIGNGEELSVKLA
jgi:caffeoyl-CoA O-methyltransferase